MGQQWPSPRTIVNVSNQHEKSKIFTKLKTDNMANLPVTPLQTPN